MGMMANTEQMLNKTSFEDKPQFQQQESFNDVLLYEGNQVSFTQCHTVQLTWTVNSFRTWMRPAETAPVYQETNKQTNKKL